ncbi:MAG TPA: hypothetical protein VGH84_10705 [Steroidobacteraceae bacterium]|jgi:single-stranded DNA-binding protein
MTTQTTKDYRKTEPKATGEIIATVRGAIIEQAVARTTRKGATFATARLQAGDQRVSVITFQADAVAALLALGAGELATLTGKLTLKNWSDKNGTVRAGLDLVADSVTPLGASRSTTDQRASAALASMAPDDPLRTLLPPTAAPTPSAAPDFDDEIPF